MVRHLQRARLALRAGRARRGDDGIALVAAIGVAIVALMLATTVVAVTVRSTTATGEGRDRDQAYAAAEAGLDAASAVLAGGSAQWTSLCPAAPATTTPAVPLTPTSSYETAVTFGSSLSASGGVTGTVACGATTAAYAQVTSTGTARTGSGVQQQRALTAVVALSSPSTEGVLGNNLDLSGASSGVIDAPGSGNTLGVRVATGNGSCGSSMQVHVDMVVSTGNLLTSSSCHIYGSVKAAAGVTTGSSSVIDGSVLTKPGMPVVRGLSSTTGPVSTSADDPAWTLPALPRITDALEQWTSQGFTTKPWSVGCSLVASTTYTLALTGPTIYDTRALCPSGVTAGSSSRIKVTGGDVVLLVNGFNGGLSSKFTADTGARRVWVVAPAAPSGPSYCPSPARNITFQSSSGTASTAVDGVPGPKLFLYSPCTVTLGSSVVITGQVWGDQVTVGLSVTLHLADLGIPTSSGGSGSGGVTRISTS